MLEELGVGMWTELVWIKTGTSGRLLETC